MANYQKTDWKDRIVEYPNRIELIDNGDGTHTVVNKPGTIEEEGLVVNAEKLNNIEDGIKTNEGDIESHLNNNTPHREIASIERKEKDENDIFTKIEWKRSDGTLFKTSELSGDSPNYDTRTVKFYEDDGTTVKEEFTLSLSYDEDDVLVDEVIQ